MSQLNNTIFAYYIMQDVRVMQLTLKPRCNFHEKQLSFIFQYSAIDTSPLSLYVMHPFWNFIVQVSKKFYLEIVLRTFKASEKPFFF